MELLRVFETVRIYDMLFMDVHRSLIEVLESLKQPSNGNDGDPKKLSESMAVFGQLMGLMRDTHGKMIVMEAIKNMS